MWTAHLKTKPPGCSCPNEALRVESCRRLCAPSRMTRASHRERCALVRNPRIRTEHCFITVFSELSDGVHARETANHGRRRFGAAGHSRCTRVCMRSMRSLQAAAGGVALTQRGAQLLHNGLAGLGAGRRQQVSCHEGQLRRAATQDRDPEGWGSAFRQRRARTWRYVRMLMISMSRRSRRWRKRVVSDQNFAQRRDAQHTLSTQHAAHTNRECCAWHVPGIR
jgi:hypothetical protein